MAGWAADCVVLTAPADLGQKLGDHKSILCFLDMLAECPPPEVIDFLDFLVRTLETRYIFSHPVGSGFVRNSLPEMGVILAVEGADIVSQRCVF